MAIPKVGDSLDNAKANTIRAFSSWPAFKESIRVKDSLATETVYVDAHPRWINEGMIYAEDSIHLRRLKCPLTPAQIWSQLLPKSKVSESNRGYSAAWSDVANSMECVDIFVLLRGHLIWKLESGIGM